MQLIYLGSCVVAREKIPALAELERELQIEERFHLEDAPSQLLGEVLAGGQDLVTVLDLLKPDSHPPELVGTSQFESQAFEPEPDTDLKVQEGVTAPIENIQEEEDTKRDKTLKIEQFETEDNLNEIFSLNKEFKLEEIGKR